MLTKNRAKSLPIHEKNISSVLLKNIPDETFPSGVIDATDFIIHYHGEEPCTDFYSVQENYGDFITAKSIGRLWHLGFQCNEYHFNLSESTASGKFFGGFSGYELGFLDSIRSTDSPNGKAFVDIPLSKFYIRGNSIPIEIKDKVEAVNAKILLERNRLTAIQQSKGFKYGWISYKLQDFMQNYRQEVEKLFEEDLYFYFPQNPIYGDRYNQLPVMDAIKYIAA